MEEVEMNFWTSRPACFAGFQKNDGLPIGFFDTAGLAKLTDT